jgi:hypothetical protein
MLRAWLRVTWRDKRGAVEILTESKCTKLYKQTGIGREVLVSVPKFGPNFIQFL